MIAVLLLYVAKKIPATLASGPRASPGTGKLTSEARERME
jgi:hypothetical protein